MFLCVNFKFYFISACADAYLTPCVKTYVESFCSGFQDIKNVKILFMQSDGGLTPVQKYVKLNSSM